MDKIILDFHIYACRGVITTSDILTSVYGLNEQEDTLPLFERLKEAFADSADYATILIGMENAAELYLCFISSLSSAQRLDFLLGTPITGDLSARLERYRGTGFKEGTFENCVQALCHGSAVICKVRSSSGLILNLSESQQRSVGSPVTENVLQGPMNAFNESLDVNTALIRQQIRSSQLKLWETIVGTASHTRVALFSYSDAVDPDLLSQLKEKLEQIQTDGIQDSAQLLRLLMARKRMLLFPLAVTTERPDRVAESLLAGKVIIMIDGSPFALIVPSVYTDFWRSPEDKYVNPHVTSFLHTLRVLAMFINLFLPAMYVALTSVNVDVNRLEISLAAAASREGVPYPVFVETLLMLITTDFITEAGLRLPKTISSTVTMVGGVVLGQAIIQANIVSHLLVIVVAATAITNFIVIDYHMGLVQRVLKYFVVIGATIAGLLGIVFCLVCLVIYLSCLESFGTPYLTPLWHKKKRLGSS
ncbi:spore germination protein [Paenibacillus chondroitinus]|uniref:Spore germination protein n=1 Tax=Paenibacillus chondroitinus TaxID=59842 RepID=A0ABU6DJN6_9BACL|nr:MULTISPECIES: spore germination protein [Paenibacillus]MCY9660961.1 spore germination protein [Paenibacillus anseongense]MEB4797980.1 spore germination protein [Paenibacillus chondroitinus]